jgi:hypothetical protein
MNWSFWTSDEFGVNTVRQMEEGPDSSRKRRSVVKIWKKIELFHIGVP